MSVRVLAVLLVGWKMRSWLRAFAASRRMRLFYERQTPERKREIEASWKQGSKNGVYTKPLPGRLAALCLSTALALLSALIYFTCANPTGLHHR